MLKQTNLNLQIIIKQKPTNGNNQTNQHKAKNQTTNTKSNVYNPT